MKRMLILGALLAALSSPAAAVVTPKDAYKAVLNLFTYDAGGKLLQSGTAFYVDEQGNAVTAYHLLENATRAVVVDAKGKQFDVTRILGANSTTDLVKFSTANGGKNVCFQLTEKPATKAETLLLLRYTTSKKSAPQLVTVNSDEPYNDYRYYQISAANEKDNFACPLMDEAGRLVAIVQQNVDKTATTACAIDARFISELKITATAALNRELRALHIPKALPDNAADALTYLYMLPASDTTAILTGYGDFIAAYPDMADGYAGRATYQAECQRYAEAEADFAAALAKAQASTDSTSLQVDAIHYNLSNLIYRTVLAQKDTAAVYPGWTLTRAESEADQAYALQPYPLYVMQKGYCQYSARNYAGAYQSFEQACRDPKFASAETFFSTARALELSHGDSLRVLALLDSCVSRIPQPVSAKYAQYYLERSQRLLRAGRYRDAVLDYNEYEKAVGPKNLNENFYYLRSQAELEARMFQQALDDIRHVIAVTSQPLPFRIEEALILLRAGEFEQALQTAQTVLKELPENPDCYKIMGIAQGELGQKASALQNLRKAQELGDDTVAPFLEKYQ